MNRECLACDNAATWIHHDGKWNAYYCDDHINLDAPGEQSRISEDESS